MTKHMVHFWSNCSIKNSLLTTKMILSSYLPVVALISHAGYVDCVFMWHLWSLEEVLEWLLCPPVLISTEHPTSWLTLGHMTGFVSRLHLLYVRSKHTHLDKHALTTQHQFLISLFCAYGLVSSLKSGPRHSSGLGRLEKFCWKRTHLTYSTPVWSKYA